jgi:hypothetical protein
MRGGVTGPKMRGGVVAELGILAEHPDQVLLEAHHQGVDPGVEITFAPSNPIWGE